MLCDLTFKAVFLNVLIYFQVLHFSDCLQQGEQVGIKLYFMEHTVKICTSIILGKQSKAKIILLENETFKKGEMLQWKPYKLNKCSQKIKLHLRALKI